MKLIKTQDAVGHVLCHDITQIIKGVTKDALFRKGHIVTEEDIPLLLSVGKEHLYVWENDESMMHENDAAMVLLDMCKNEHMSYGEIKEGKIELKSEIHGLLKVDRKALFTVNSFGQMMIATRHGNTVVNPGDKLAGMRIIPLVIEKEKMDKVRSLITSPILEIKPFVLKKAAVITTGSEVYKGTHKRRLQAMYHIVICDDDDKMVTEKINEALTQGVDIVLCTGGMSVDPDDRTPLAIKNTGANIISYGSPILPGAMFLLSYKGEVPIVGLPGCVMYAKRTVFDLVLCRLLAKDVVTYEELCDLGEGGLCLGCDICTYPNCGFGK